MRMALLGADVPAEAAAGDDSYSGSNVCTRGDEAPAAVTSVREYSRVQMRVRLFLAF
jgi:hypothetical protein